MENQPSNKQDTYTELTEPTISEPDLDSVNETVPEETVTDTAAEIDNKNKEKRKSKLKTLGGIAIVAAATYGAFKTGQLDSIPIAHSGEAGIASTSISAGFLAAQTVGMVNSFRKK